mgnify:CR=1 FL=1
MDVIRPFVTSKWAWMLLAAGVLWCASDRVRNVLVRDPRFMADPARLRLGGPSPEVVEPVERRLRALGRLSLFDPRFEEKLRGALEEVPVVASVESVRRKWPNRYSVALRYHRPAAVVVEGEHAVPVTAAGLALPLEPYRASLAGLPRIEGVDRAPPRPGRPWHSESLKDALATVAQLSAHRDELAALGLAVIDVRGAGDPLQGVVLRGRDGIVVRWGRPRATVGENPVSRKVAYLRIAARHIEQVRGQEIDVRYGRALYLRESSAP